jgi:DNA-binding MarR family transcriptional regulator
LILRFGCGCKDFGWILGKTYYEMAAERMMTYMGRKHGPAHHTRNTEKFTKGGMFMLNILLESDGDKSAGEIAAEMGISSARVAAVLGQLEAKDFISRRIDAEDRRKVYVRLTDAGRSHIEGFRAEMKGMLLRAFKRMGKRDTEEFQRLMKKFYDIMREEHCEDI